MWFSHKTVQIIYRLMYYYAFCTDVWVYRCVGPSILYRCVGVPMCGVYRELGTPVIMRGS